MLSRMNSRSHRSGRRSRCPLPHTRRPAAARSCVYGPDGGDHHPGARRPSRSASTAARRPRSISGQDCAAAPSVSRTASSLSADRPARAMRAVAARRRQVLRRSACRRSRWRRTGRCRIHAGCGHGPMSTDATRASPAARASSPSTCGARNAVTTWYQILACCGCEHPVPLGREVQEPVRAGAVVGGGQRRLG